MRVWLLVFTWAMCRHAVMFINIGRDDSNWVPFELTDGNKLIREHTRNWFYISFFILFYFCFVWLLASIFWDLVSMILEKYCKLSRKEKKEIQCIRFIQHIPGRTYAFFYRSVVLQIYICQFLSKYLCSDHKDILLELNYFKIIYYALYCYFKHIQE